MDEQPLATKPISKPTTILRDKFYEQYANQAEQMDGLARQLIGIELAIPGLYATVLKLTQGKDATLTADGWLYVTFGCWFLALALTVAALFPRRWQVDPTKIKPDPTGKGSQELSLEEFFYKSARHKFWLLAAACLFFGAGIVGAVVVLF